MVWCRTLICSITSDRERHLCTPLCAVPQRYAHPPLSVCACVVWHRPSGRMRTLWPAFSSLHSKPFSAANRCVCISHRSSLHSSFSAVMGVGWCSVQVFDSYGRKCNSRFFVNYGFALDQNEDNEALLYLGVRTEDELFRQKCALLFMQPNQPLKEFQIPGQRRTSSHLLCCITTQWLCLVLLCAATYSDAKTKEMFSFLRVVYADSFEFDVLNHRIRGKEGLKVRSGLIEI
jgi:hypothetical protein